MAEAAESTIAEQETLNEVTENAMNPISEDFDGTDLDDSGATSTLDTDLDLEGQSDKDSSQDGGDKSDGDQERDQEVTGEGEEKAEKGQEARIDKDPVFRRLHGENQQLRNDLNQLVGKIDAMIQQGGTKGGQGSGMQGKESDYVDITTMSQEDRDEWYETDRLGYEANLAKQIASEAEERVVKRLEEKGNKDTVKTTVEKFARENEGFTEMLNSGKISDFINSSPENRIMHNVFSAYKELTKDTKEAKTKKEAEEKVQKNFEAKWQQKPLRGGSSAPKNSASPLEEQLKNPEKYGGAKAVMANRLRAMRKRLRG